MVQARTDEQRLEALWRAHYPAVLAYGRRRADDEVAAEVAAEVFATAWRRLEEVPEEPRGWLLGVARRTLANHRRTESRRRLLRVRLEAEAHPPLQQAPELDDAGLAAALSGLTEREREALRLVAWDGLSPSEAATAAGCSRAAFRVRLHRARRRLAAGLDHQRDATGEPAGSSGEVRDGSS